MPLPAPHGSATEYIAITATFSSLNGFIYIHYAAPAYSARIGGIYLLPFGKVWLGSIYWSPSAKSGNEY